jgi:hypothetical protein
MRLEKKRKEEKKRRNNFTLTREPSANQKAKLLFST